MFGLWFLRYASRHINKQTDELIAIILSPYKVSPKPKDGESICPGCFSRPTVFEKCVRI